LTRDRAADAILAQALQTVDFPAVVNKAYADGVRLFIEIGPGASCYALDRPDSRRSAARGPGRMRPGPRRRDQCAAVVGPTRC